MKLEANLMPLCLGYPEKKDIPRNLIDTPIANKFQSTKKILPFLEQFASENNPHRIKHISYQFGMIEGKRAVKYYLRKKPVRLIYSEEKDPLIEELNNNRIAKIKFPPSTAPTQVARMFREMALKWVAEQFFKTLSYISFDEPILYSVNPDLLVIPSTESAKIIELGKGKQESLEKSGIKDQRNNNGNMTYKINLKDSIFVEIKAYHRITSIGEKEVMQAFNYSALGGKTLLIHSGHIGDLKGFSILNKNADKHEKCEDGYDPKIYKKYSSEVSEKHRKMAKSLNLYKGQDQYDTRGIYFSVKSKLKKMYKYTKRWPSTINYTILKSPEEIMNFLKSEEKLGIIEPKAFYNLLKQKKLNVAARLYKNIQTRYLEEIMVDPTILYPI